MFCVSYPDEQLSMIPRGISPKGSPRTSYPFLGSIHKNRGPAFELFGFIQGLEDVAHIVAINFHGMPALWRQWV
jgi:hypothetical protein